MRAPTSEEIVKDICERFIDRRVIINVFRAAHVEAMIARALGPSYSLTEGWEGYDAFHKASRWRLEIKQSAARQAWHGRDVVVSKPVFDIAARKGEFDGTDWRQFDAPKRLPNAYVFAWHDRTDDTCDQRDAEQWKFYVVSANDLSPEQKTISLSRLVALTEAACWRDLLDRVEAVRARAS